jgi:hypothetical protein
MWIDESDTTQLSQRLRVGPRELLEAVGGPWQVVERIPEHEMERPGTLFVGRAGPSVGILVADEASPDVTVGMAVGEWSGAHPLRWSITAPIAHLRTPSAGTPDAETDSLLDDLRAAVDAAAAAKAPALVVCRYCGILVGPEFAFGEDVCMGCATTVFGVVY